LSELQDTNGSKKWWVLISLSLIYASTNGILLHTLPILYPKLIDSFGWSQSQVTLPATMLLVVGAVTSFPAGVLLDRISPRLMICGGLITIAGALYGYSMVTELWELTVIYALLGTALSACGLVSNMLIVSRWFTHMRGRATGILLMSSSIGGAVFPLIVGSLLDEGSWREALRWLALVIMIFALLPAIFYLKDQPLNFVKQASKDAAASIVSHGPTVVTALKDSRFYLIALATGAVWFTIVGVTQHLSVFLSSDIGVDFSKIPLVFSTFFACSIVGKLMFGWLGDHFNKTLMMIISIATLATGLLLLRNIDSASDFSIFSYAVVAGIGFSGAFTMIQLLFATYYAGSSFGKILAILMLVDTLSGALGTKVLAEIREASGSYLPGINLMFGLLAVAVIALLIARPQQRQEPHP